MRRSRIAIGLLFLAFGAAPSLAQSIPLTGGWSFAPDPARTLKPDTLATVADPRTIQVPGSWQAQFDDLRDYAGVAWYWRTVAAVIPDGRVPILRFDAVDYRAEVFVNGEPAGIHEGGYLPFELEVTPLWRPGDNLVAVRVTDPGPGEPEVEGLRYDEIPHGKQDWYVQTSGLWQEAALDVRPSTRLGHAHISAAADGSFSIDAPIIGPAGGSSAAGRITAAIVDAGGRTVWRETRDVPAGDARQTYGGRIGGARPWSPDTPTLYTLRLELQSGDVRSWRFGFRTFETRHGQFVLNGRPIYLRGALDQDFHPDTIYTIPSLESVMDQMRTARALGFNLLRHHVKVPDPRYLQAADETGLLIWYDVPNWDAPTGTARARALATLQGMIDRDWNHPSIVAITIVNEAWGMDMSSTDQRAWLARAWDDARAIAPGWLVVDNSPCCENFHVATDIADFHHYAAMPDHADRFERVAGELADRAAWLFSPHGDATPRGDEPLVLSEFGSWGLPRLPAARPWWFGRRFRDREMTQPAGVDDRFAAHGYASVFGTLDALADATQWHQFRALKRQIESIRARGAIQGYVVTELTDVNWEANGVLDMWRRPKVHAEALAAIQRDDLLLARADRRNYVSGETVRVVLLVSRYSVARPGDAVAWTLEGEPLGGRLRMPAVEQGAVALVGTIEFDAPLAHAPAKRTLVVRELAGSRVVRENSLDLHFYPPAPVGPLPAVEVHDPAGRLGALGAAMADRGAPAASGDAIMVASALDDAARRALGSGRTVLLLPGDEPGILAGGLEVVPRKGSSLDGDWITGFHWVRHDREPFVALGSDALPGFEAEAIAPRAVIRGLGADRFGDALAGMFYGWIHDNVATLLQARAGGGRLLVCTLAVADTYGRDAYATLFWDALLRYAASPFEPQLVIDLQP